MTERYRTLILVAHRAGARFFESHGPKADWVLVADVDHAEGAAKTSELVTDQQGQVMESARDGQHAAQPRVSPTEQIAVRFAKQLAERLRHDRMDNRLGRVVLVAPPPFLGRLRAELDEPTARLVVAELNQNFAHAKPLEIRRALSDLISV
jgi:protein required for attachment to host cells